MVMIAKRTGLIRGLGGARKIRKGVTTADDGAAIVRSHPHLWAPIQVDYPEPYLAWPDEGQTDGPSVDELRVAYDSACQTIAAMHAAAVGVEGHAPIRGVVEDVADLRAERDELRRLVEGLTGQPEAVLVDLDHDEDGVDEAPVEVAPPATKPRKSRAKATADDDTTAA